jgi:hypothetical protein
LPCLMAKKREPLSTSGKTCPQVTLSVSRTHNSQNGNLKRHNLMATKFP